MDTPRPTERRTVRVGDYVLAQDPDSGELAYQVVLAIAVPQELDVSNLDFADDSLHCAPGHVVWQSGAGWKRVAKVGESDTLHCVKNELRVDQADEAFRIDCYDLIVDDFHTFLESVGSTPRPRR